MEYDEEFAGEIAEEVMKVLSGKGFFALLDDLFCPMDPKQPPAVCDGTLATSMALLNKLGFDADAISDVTQVFASKGGFCDCEVLYNVADESRLKAEHWKAEVETRHASKPRQ